MRRSETALVLGYAAAYDYRNVDDTTVAAWHDLLGDLDLTDVREAIKRHYQTSTDRIMPAHVRAHVKVIREERRAAEAVKALPPSRFETDPARDERNTRNAEKLRTLLAELAQRRSIPEEPARQLTGSDLIRQRALEVARTERRGARS